MPAPSLITALFFLSLTTASPAIDPSLATRAARFQTIHTATADFTQEREVSLVADVLRASGTLALRAPDAMRLELNAPEPITLVAAGGTVTLLDADGVPVPLPPEVSGLTRFARQLTGLLLGAKSPARFNEHWQGANTVVLTARDVENPYVEITMRFPPSGPLPEEVVLRERGGDRTTIRLSGIRLNPPLEDERFRIHPSDGPEH